MREVQIITHTKFLLFGVSYEVIVIHDGVTVERRTVKPPLKVKKLADGTYLFKSKGFSVIADKITGVNALGKSKTVQREEFEE